MYLKYLVLDFHVDGHEKRDKAVRDAVKQLVAVTGVFRASKPLYVDPPEGVVHHSDGCLRLEDFLPELLEASLQEKHNTIDRRLSKVLWRIVVMSIKEVCYVV